LTSFDASIHEIRQSRSFFAETAYSKRSCALSGNQFQALSVKETHLTSKMH
jgi:hypothetical protein